MLGAKECKILELYTSTLLKKALKALCSHFKFIHFCFFAYFFGGSRFQCQYQHPAGYITDNVNLKISNILFNNSVMNKCFQKKMENANIILFYKKGDKQIIKNYQPVSLLPPCSKIFGKKTIFLSLNI